MRTHACRLYKLAAIALSAASAAAAAPEEGVSWPPYKPVISELDQYSALAMKFPNSAAVQQRALGCSRAMG